MVPYLSVGVLVVVLVLTSFLATVSRISIHILQGLHAYLLPEEGDEKKLADDSKENEGASKEKEAEGKEKNSGGVENASKLNKKEFFNRGQRRSKKDRFVWDEAGSQIVRIHLAESQLETRKYFREFDEAVLYSFLGLIGFLTREILQFSSSALATRCDWAPYLRPDDRVSFMVGAFATYKVIRHLARVGYDPRMARSSERLLNWGAGLLGFAIACSILILAPNSVLDFGIDDAVVDAGKAAHLFIQKKGGDDRADFSFSPTLVKLITGVGGGIISGLLLGPALRNVKNFWIGTDQLGWNIAVLKRSSLQQLLLKFAVVLPLLVTFMWIKPMAEIFIRTDSDPVSLYQSHLHELGEGPMCRSEGVGGSQECNKMTKELGEFAGLMERQPIGAGARKDSVGVVEANPRRGVIGRMSVSRQYDWAADLGVSDETFFQIQLWGLFFTGMLQICVFRVNLQSYCNGAVLSWYESLHQSTIHNAEVTKAKIFLNNYFVCRIALQSLVPGVLVVMFLGLARSRGPHLDPLVEEGAFFVAPSFVRALMLFGSWWTVFTWSLQTCLILAMFRLGILSSTW